jgi:hypothetical protein
LDPLLLILAALLLFVVFFVGSGNPVSKVVQTRIVGKRVKYQESITPSGNAYVPVKMEVFTLDTEITYDILVSKSTWDKLDKGDLVELNKHLNGEYRFKRRVKE